MKTEEFGALALSFPGTVEALHFDRIAFKVINKRSFATLHPESGTANLKLSASDQSVFCAFDKDAVYPVDNKWGLQRWTTFVLEKIPEELMLIFRSEQIVDWLKLEKGFDDKYNRTWQS